MAVRIQMRRDTGANWTLNDPILAEGEMGVELDTYRWKLGDGTSHWSTLPYSNQIFSGQSLISDNSANPALTIRQQGSGPALLVEDQAAVDPSPFVITSSGNIGIGTATPSAKVDVQGNSVFVDNSVNPAVKITQTGAGAAFYVEDAAGDTSPFVIDASGNVGIGTASPTAPLDVTGNARVTGQITAADGMLGNVTIGITTENTIDTFSGQLIIDSAAGQTNINDNVVLGGTLQFGGNVDANSFDITNIDNLGFDLTPDNAGGVGKFVWNDSDGTLDLGLKGGNVTLQLGQEMTVLCYNAEATTLTKGTAVYVFGSSSGKMSVKRANAGSELTSIVFGIVAEEITSGSTGFVTTYGYVRGLNTLGYAVGSTIWLSTTSGQFTPTRPTQPDHGVVIGTIALADATNGAIFVHPDNGYELDELHNVLITSVANRDVLSYDSVTSLWKNKPILDAIKDVDGSGSGIDADLLDGQHGSYYAPINNPTFTGTPAAPTAAADTNSTQLATTAFVLGQASLAFPLALGNVNVGSSFKFAREDHVHPTTGLGLTSGTLAQFASTTSSQLAGVISDETGTDALVFANSPTLTGTPLAPTAAVDTNTTQIATTAFVIGQGYLKSATAATTYQPLDADLTAIAGLIGTSGLLKKTATDTWTLDTNTYLTGNQTITLSGDVSGSGTTSISVTLANTGVVANTYGSSTAIPTITVDSKGRITNITTNNVAVLPDQTSNAGKFLTTNGTVASWATVDALPSQSGNAGKYLTTDGTTATWATVSGGGGSSAVTTDVVLSNSWWLGV